MEGSGGGSGAIVTRTRPVATFTRCQPPQATHATRQRSRQPSTGRALSASTFTFIFMTGHWKT
jgi:hypothetical protein